LNDRGRGEAVGREAVEDVLEGIDRPEMKAEQVAVLAGDAVALRDLGRLARNLWDPLQPSW
jgi:hypothetical protein